MFGTTVHYFLLLIYWLVYSFMWVFALFFMDWLILFWFFSADIVSIRSWMTLGTTSVWPGGLTLAWPGFSWTASCESNWKMSKSGQKSKLMAFSNSAEGLHFPVSLDGWLAWTCGIQHWVGSPCRQWPKRVVTKSATSFPGIPWEPLRSPMGVCLSGPHRVMYRAKVSLEKPDVYYYYCCCCYYYYYY